MTNLIIYTAITNDYDQLVEKQPICDSNHFVAFTDKTYSNTQWEIRPSCREFTDANRNAKIHKILSHKYFPETEYSLWMDGTILLQTSTKYLIDKYIKNTDVAVFKHPTRNCLYAEAQVCQNKLLDDPQIIQQQIDRYKAEGYPENNGLVEATIILRRHTEQTKQFNELWWEEIKKGSRRDQISFNYAASKCNVKIGYFDGHLTRHNVTKYFHKKNHLGVREWIQH